MDAINLNNYKLIAEHLANELERYSNSRSGLGAGYSEEEYKARKDRADKAYHLYLRKMNEFLKEEKSNERILMLTPDTDFTVPSKDGLIKKEK